MSFRDLNLTKKLLLPQLDICSVLKRFPPNEWNVDLTICPIFNTFPFHDPGIAVLDGNESKTPIGESQSCEMATSRVELLLGIAASTPDFAICTPGLLLNILP